MAKIKIERPDRSRLSQLGVDTWSSWECDISTFPWSYSQDEMGYIQSGRVIVSTDEDEIELKGGDLVTFPKGLKCTWKVVEPIKKVYRFVD